MEPIAYIDSFEWYIGLPFNNNISAHITPSLITACEQACAWQPRDIVDLGIYCNYKQGGGSYMDVRTFFQPPPIRSGTTDFLDIYVGSSKRPIIITNLHQLLDWAYNNESLIEQYVLKGIRLVASTNMRISKLFFRKPEETSLLPFFETDNNFQFYDPRITIIEDNWQQEGF